MADYGANITYASYPDYDDWGPFDNYWGCTDWMIWYDRLEEYYGTDSARERWVSAWDQQSAGSGTWDCLYNDQFREFVQTNNLGLESAIADVVTTVQDTATNTLSSFNWLSKRITKLRIAFRFNLSVNIRISFLVIDILISFDII